MRILAMDTALNACSVAVTENGEVRAHTNEKRARGHAESLMPMIQSLMKSAGIGFADLDLVAVTVGPGTFTGLRIGLAAARGIALAAGKPIVGVTTLEALAAAVPLEDAAGRPVIATADARRGELYLQSFRRLEGPGLIDPLTPPEALPLAKCRDRFPEPPAIILGSGVPLLLEKSLINSREYIPLDMDPDPDALLVARLAAARDIPLPGSEPPAPLYLRAPDAKLPGGVDPAP